MIKSNKYDITKWPMEIIRSFTVKLEGDDNIRYASEFPEFVDATGPQLVEDLKIFNSPHEFCLVTAIEFARRYPNHKNSQFFKKEFNSKETLEIVTKKKTIIFKTYNADPDELKRDLTTKIGRSIKKILPRLSRPDFSKEPMDLVRIYNYWLEGDDLKGKPRGGVDIPQFSNISLYKAELNKWTNGDTAFSIMADLEYCRRHPEHNFAKKSQFYKLFTDSEILDISKGKKKLIIENTYE